MVITDISSFVAINLSNYNLQNTLQQEVLQDRTTIEEDCDLLQSVAGETLKNLIKDTYVVKEDNLDGVVVTEDNLDDVIIKLHQKLTVGVFLKDIVLILKARRARSENTSEGAINMLKSLLAKEIDTKVKRKPSVTTGNNYDQDTKIFSLTTTYNSLRDILEQCKMQDELQYFTNIQTPDRRFIIDFNLEELKANFGIAFSADMTVTQYVAILKANESINNLSNTNTGASAAGFSGELWEELPPELLTGASSQGAAKFDETRLENLPKDWPLETLLAAYEVGSDGLTKEDLQKTLEQLNMKNLNITLKQLVADMIRESGNDAGAGPSGLQNAQISGNDGMEADDWLNQGGNDGQPPAPWGGI